MPAGDGVLAGARVRSRSRCDDRRCGLKLFKRRLGVAPGGRWIPADEIDFIIGAMVLSSPWLDLTAVDVVLVLGFTFVAHIIVNHVAFRLGIRDTNW